MVTRGDAEWSVFPGPAVAATAALPVAMWTLARFERILSGYPGT